MLKAGAAWLGLEGAMLLALGLAVILIPAAAGPFALRAAGWILALSGILGLVGVFATRREAHPALGLLSALLALMIGGFLLLAPPDPTGTVAPWAVAAYLIPDGVLMVAYGFDQKRRGQAHWPALSGAGAVGCILGLGVVTLITPDWLGLAIGLDMIVSGAALMWFSRRAGRQGLQPSAPVRN